MSGIQYILVFIFTTHNIQEFKISILRENNEELKFV